MAANINDLLYDLISADNVVPVDLIVESVVYDGSNNLVSITVERGLNNDFAKWAIETPVLLSVYDVDGNLQPIGNTLRSYKALRSDNTFTSLLPFNAFASDRNVNNRIQVGALVRSNIDARLFRDLNKYVSSLKAQLDTFTSGGDASDGLNRGQVNALLAAYVPTVAQLINAHAITHVTDFNTVVGRSANDVFGKGATTNSVLGYKKALDAKIGLFRPAELHNESDTGEIVGFDHETGTVRPTMPAGLVSLQIQTGHITLQVVTGSTNLVNSGSDNYRLRYREKDGSWNTYDLAKGTAEGGNTPYTFYGTVQELDLAKLYEYQLSVDAGANYLDLHSAEYINPLVDQDNFQEFVAAYNAEVTRQIEAGVSHLTGTRVISLIEHAPSGSELQTRFLRGNPYSDEVTTLPAVTGRRAGEFIVEKAGTTYTLKFLSTDAAVAIPDRNKLTFTTSQQRFFRYDPLSTDSGTSVRNYNLFLGWYRVENPGPNAIILLYLRQSMLSGLGISASARTTQFRAAVVPTGTTPTQNQYLPYVREATDSQIGPNNEHYLAYSCPQGATDRPHAQNTTYDIYFKDASVDFNDLNIFPATAPGTRWVTIAGGSTGGGQGTTLSQSQLDAIARVPPATTLANIPTATEKANLVNLPTATEKANFTNIPTADEKSRIPTTLQLASFANIPTPTEKAALPRIPTATTDANKRWGTDDSGVYGWQDETEASSGLDQAAVDARIKAEVDPWALDGNKSKIPKGKVDIQSPRNLVATLSLTGTTSAGDIDYGGNTNTGTASFTLESTTFIIKRVFFDSSDTNLAIKLATGTTALTQTQKDLLHSAHFQLNDGTTLDFESLFFKNDVTGAGGVSEYEWSGVPTTGFIAGTNTIKVFLDITENNYVPIPTADEDGDVLTAGTNGTSSWQRPLRGVAESRLRTGVGAGLALTDLNGFRSTNIQLISPTFDMDDRTGIVIAEATLTINTPSATNLKFVSGTGELTHTLQGWRTIQDLLAVDVFHATNASGVKLDEVDLYLGSINAGSVELWLERNANNELAYSIQYTNNNSATGSCSLGSTVNILFAPSDAGATPDPAEMTGGSGRNPQRISFTNTTITTGTGGASYAFTPSQTSVSGTNITIPATTASADNSLDNGGTAGTTANLKAGTYIFTALMGNVSVGGTSATDRFTGIVMDITGGVDRVSETPTLVPGGTRTIGDYIEITSIVHTDDDITDLAIKFNAVRMSHFAFGFSGRLDAIKIYQVNAGGSGGGGGSAVPQVITLTTNNTVGTGSLNTASTGDRIRGGRINFPVIPAGTNNYITSSVANNQANCKAGLYRIMVEFSSVYTSGTNDSTKEAGVTVNIVGSSADSVRTFLPVGITGTTAARAPRGIVAEQFAYFPTDQTNIGLRVDARRMGSSLYGVQATVGRIIVVPIGGGGGSSTPAPAGRAFNVGNYRPTEDNTFTDSTANTWTSPATLITAPAITSAQAGGMLIKAHIEGEVTVAATGGTDRILLRAMIRRTRGSTTETIDQVEIYLRNMTATNLRSTIGNADLSYIDTAQAGDVYSVQVQQRAQQANKSVIYRMADNLLQVAPMGG